MPKGAKGRRTAPHRRATRRVAPGEAAGAGGLTVVAGREHVDDLEVVLDPQLGLSDLVAGLASEMVRAVALQDDYHHREHTLSVLIDHQLGGGVKDCWVAEGRKGRGLRDRTAAQMASNPEALFEDIDSARAVRILSTALTNHRARSRTTRSRT